jgi:hypothetical protein
VLGRVVEVDGTGVCGGVAFCVGDRSHGMDRGANKTQIRWDAEVMEHGIGG